MCIKGLRLVTLGFPEKFSPSDRGTSELRLKGVLRSSRQTSAAGIMLVVERLTRRFSQGGRKERATGALLSDLRRRRSRPASAPSAGAWPFKEHGLPYPGSFGQAGVGREGPWGGHGWGQEWGVHPGCRLSR